MRTLAISLFAVMLAACGDDASPPPGSSGSSGTVEAKPGPTLTEVMKMTGSLHVMWTNPAACDSVELERKDGEPAEFKVVYTLPGAADNKHDGSASADMLYTYRARCKVGAEYTQYSNEMSGNPVK